MKTLKIKHRANLVLYGGLLMAGPVQSVDLDALQQLQDKVAQQQEQLRRQAEMLVTLQNQINALKPQDKLSATAQAAPEAERKLSAIDTSGGEALKLNISGQVNRAVNQVSDGKRTDFYFVDHSTSGTRVLIDASASVNDDLLLDSRIELAIAPDNSAAVSQSTQAPADSFNQRWAELSLTSKQYGKLSLGKGDAASNTTAEADLSGTLSVQNSSISDIVYGMFFREHAGSHNLSTIKVSTAFNNLDGLNRESRLRYDTPRLYGAQLSSSMMSNRRSDLALYWDGQGAGFNAAARAAISNPNINNNNLTTLGANTNPGSKRYDGSFSLLHVASGLNVTVSSGVQKRDTHNDDHNLYGKLGWLARLNRFGNTAFIADYTRAKNTPAAHDVGHATGIGIDQFFDKYNTEVYLQYRRFTLDRYTGPMLDDISAASFGARVRF